MPPLHDFAEYKVRNRIKINWLILFAWPPALLIGALILYGLGVLIWEG